MHVSRCRSRFHFRFNTLGKTYAELACSLVCGIDDEPIANFFGDDLVDDFEDDTTEQRRNMALIAITVMGMMVFARSRRCNRYTTDHDEVLLFRDADWEATYWSS